MRKVLLSSAAVCGLALAATPAFAEDGLKLDVGGWFKGYGVFIDQDEVANREVNEFDFIRNTEIHFTGETTLDNGLVVGYHIETDADGQNSLGVEESYMYLSGGWGRVNFGAEDGVAYLLQVAAPAADENLDGLRQFVQPVNYNVATGGASVFNPAFTEDVAFDYDQDPTGYADKLTYLTPVLNGFQGGLSYTPDVSSSLAGDTDGFANDLDGVREQDEANEFGEAYEAAVRYEGQFNELGVALGAGYSLVEFEDGAPNAGTEDDRAVWNVGVDFDWGPFGLGAVYLEDDAGEVVNQDDRETIVVGLDYTTGPFRLGASWYNDEQSLNAATDIDTDRYTGGVVYTYGPGMTFRGSVSYIEHDFSTNALPGGKDELEATSVLLGTQVLF